MRSIIDTPAALGAQIAELFRAAVARNPEAAFGYAAVDVPPEIYAALAESGVDFSRCTAFNACEFLGAPQQLQSLREQLFDRTPFGAVYTPEEGTDYDALIREKGGMELVLLGLGERGHVAFCEPGVQFGSASYTVKLADATKKNAAAAFGGLEHVPTHGVTMGLGTIEGAKQILIVACGEDKANAAQKTLVGRPETYIPASLLQLHTDVTLYLDQDAASKL